MFRQIANLASTVATRALPRGVKRRTQVRDVQLITERSDEHVRVFLGRSEYWKPTE